MRYFIAMNLFSFAPLLFCLVVGLATAAPPVPIPAPALNLIGQAEQAIASGDDRAAEALVSRVPPNSLDAVQLARIQIVRAEISLRRNQAEGALRSLPASSAHVPSLSARIELLRGRAYFLSGDPVSAVRSLVARARSLGSAGAITDNNDQIWNGLVSTPLPESALARIGAEDPITRGWLSLAQVLRQGASAAAISQWRQAHPGHPGVSKTALVRSAPSSNITITGLATPNAAPAMEIGAFAAAGGETGPYALLLPISGALASGGRAVRDGFISAWFDASVPRPAIRVYDTGESSAQAIAAYQTALRDGAGFIVGPLTKDAVSVIAAQGPSLPWLALNYLDSGIGTALQFGLGPEDEARAAAYSAAASGQRRAIAMVPDNDWGARALQAFSAGFSERGGRVLHSSRYRQGSQDFGKPLQQLLGLDRSEQRHRDLTAVLGVPSEFEPSPREDADALFIPLRAAEAPVLIPQLDFYRARQLAIYTLSAAHEGSISAQLDGLRLCDMPWVMDASGPWAGARTRAQAQFPNTLNEQPRLFALGSDAFRITRALASGDLGGGRDISGATGRLSLMPGGRIQRQLDCRNIRGGRPAAVS